MTKLAFQFGPRTYDPAPLAGCICPPPVTVDGVVLQPHDPSCLVPGHGCTQRILGIGRESVYFRDSRRVGVPKAASRVVV